MSKVDILGKAVVDAVKSYMATALKSVLERLDAIESRPAPEKGDKGEDADPAEIAKAVATAIDALPKPSDGKSVTIEDVAPMIELAVAKGLLDLERRATETLQRACEAMPKPKDGVDGKDGMGFDDLTADYDGDRLLTLSLTRGDEVKDFTLTLPIPIYRGLYSVDKEYQLGDNTTWAGATWIAMKDSPVGVPGSEGSDWAQAVKRGDRGKKGEVITVPSTYKFGDQK